MKVNVNGELVKLYGMGLVCIKHDSFFVYNTEFNSTKMELVYSCKISEMQDITIKQKWFSTKFDFVRGEEKFNLDMDDWKRFAPVISSYGGVSLHKQSHGESFMSLVENRFGGNGLYILDEPEAALSPMRMMRLLCYIQKLVNDNSQFIISTHSPILMTFPNAEILEITEDGINSVDYKETEHFLITKRFMDAPEKMIESLLD